MLVSIS